MWLTLESAPSDLDLLPLKALAIIVASDLELTRKLISVTIGNVRMYARLRLRAFFSFKRMAGKFLFALVACTDIAMYRPSTQCSRSCNSLSGVILPHQQPNQVEEQEIQQEDRGMLDQRRQQAVSEQPLVKGHGHDLATGAGRRLLRAVIRATLL